MELRENGSEACSKILKFIIFLWWGGVRIVGDLSRF